MANYKITNLTNTAGKRDLKFNTTLSIEYVDQMQKKTLQVKPGETVFLQIRSLPLSVHQLRVKKLISVVEISDNELNNNIHASKPVAVAPVKVETPEEKEIRVEAATEKRKGSKRHESKTVEE